MAKQRKHGSGTVRLRSDGRWEGRVVIGYDDKGLPKTKNVLAKTKAECEKKLKSLIAAQKGSEPQPPRQTMTAAQWLDFWYQTYKKPNLRPNTQMSYERRIYQHIIPNLGPIPLNKLTTGDIQQFYTGLKQNGRLLRQEQYGKGLSDQTVRGIHTTFHAALDKAVSEKIIPKNFSDFCRLPSAKAREIQVLSPEEIQRLLIQAKEDGCFELLLLELSTGLRRGEICALQWDDLNFNTGELQVKRQVHRVKGELAVSEPKTKASNRSVILPPPVLMVLSDYKTEINSVWLFPSPLNNDSPRDPAAVRKRLTTILDRADCKRVISGTRHGHQDSLYHYRSCLYRNNSECLRSCHRRDEENRCGENRPRDRQIRIPPRYRHSAKKTGSIYLPAPQRAAPQTRHWLRQPDQRKAVGRTVFSQTSQRRPPRPKCLRPQRERMRTETGRTDCPNESRNCRPAAATKIRKTVFVQKAAEIKRKHPKSGDFRCCSGAADQI